MQYAQNPGGKADDEDAKGFAQAVSPVFEAGEQKIRQWKGGEPYGLDYKEPPNDANHGSIIYGGGALPGCPPPL